MGKTEARFSAFEKDTGGLLEVLQNISPEELGHTLADEAPTFPEYMDHLLTEKGVTRQKVLLRAGLPQKYGYKLLSGESHTTDRDKILRLCMGMKMSLKEAQRTLRLYGMRELYPKIRRDCVFIVAFAQGIYDLDQIDKMLLAEKEPPILEPLE